MWGCLFPNAGSTHMRHSGTEHGLTPFPLQAAAQQAGTNAHSSLPTIQLEPAKLSRSLHGVPQRNQRGLALWVPLREATQCSTMSHSTVGYYKQAIWQTQPKPTVRVRLSGGKSFISAHICTLVS